MNRKAEKIILGILLLAWSIMPSAALADTMAEYQNCMSNCLGSDKTKWSTELIDYCHGEVCSKQFPEGARQDLAQKGRQVGVDITGGSSCTKKFCLNVPIGNLTGFDAAQGENILGSYIAAWYGFLLGTVGILGAIMIMWGGFKYLTSRGDKGVIDTAKTQIISAITGIVLAFGTYTLLSLISPGLLKISTPHLSELSGGKDLSLPGSGGTATNRNSPANPEDIADRPAALADAYANGKAIDYSSLEIPAVDPNANLDQYDALFEKYGEQYGVDPALLKAIAAAESSGNPNAVSPAGAYGLMQMLPATASKLNGSTVTGQDLINDPELSISLAARFLSDNEQGNIYDTIAGYNGGYDNTPGSGHALSPSSDCPGALAYQCTINPGGLVETQNYVYNVSSFYNFFKR